MMIKATQGQTYMLQNIRFFLYIQHRNIPLVQGDTLNQDVSIFSQDNDLFKIHIFNVHANAIFL